MDFTIFVFPDGKMIVTSETQLSPGAAEVIKETIRAWRETENGLLVIGSARVEHKVTEVEFSVPGLEDA